MNQHLDRYETLRQERLERFLERFYPLLVGDVAERSLLFDVAAMENYANRTHFDATKPGTGQTLFDSENRVNDLSSEQIAFIIEKAFGIRDVRTNLIKLYGKDYSSGRIYKTKKRIDKLLLRTFPRFKTT